MKRTLIFTGISILAFFILLYILNKVSSNANKPELFTEVLSGDFELSLKVTGELIAENAINITGPDFSQRRDVHSFHIKIQDLVPEGTIVNKGDYVAMLDRTEYDNRLKDDLEYLAELKANLEMKILDTAVVLNSYRDEIKNQKFTVEEAAIMLKNSKYESPTSIRQAEIELDKAQRVLEQKNRSYMRKLARSRFDINKQRDYISIVERRINSLEELLSGFTIYAPEDGMVIYKKEWQGGKRKVGSTINPFDRVVATLPDLTSMLSKTYVNEIDIRKIKKGLNVTVTIDAFPKRTYTGVISYVANIGEKLQNTNDKVFEVHIKINGSDPLLKPSMTTSNKIMIEMVRDAIFIPVECVQAGTDSIQFVYTKSGYKQFVLPGLSDGKHIIIENGLEAGTKIYLNNPENPEKFKTSGEELISSLDKMEQSSGTTI